ncbi:MAG: hypothetical protein EBR82_29915 [Caulobacteraceae bacterium]|nr:hypothetical protein [Caulobacteraceae bacterium]
MRVARKIKELIRVKDALARSSQDVATAIQTMESAGMETLLVHGDNVIRRRIPELSGWTTKLAAEAEDQARARLDGVLSAAEATKIRSDKQAARLRAAKKPKLHRPS